MSALDPKRHNPRIEQAGASDENIQDVHAILMREKPEPKEGYSPMPLFILGFVSAMIFIGSVYIVRYRGDFDPLVYDERFEGKAGGAGVAKAAVDPIAEGKKLYAANCVACHQTQGQGVPGTFPPLAGSEWVVGSEERVVRILLHGLSGPVTVAGAQYNGAMPAFGQGSGYNWSDEKVSHVLTFIRQSWGNSAPAITPERVTEIRNAVGQRKTPWTADELLALP
jgi:mono/diheme cytochrome c family protein